MSVVVRKGEGNARATQPYGDLLSSSAPDGNGTEVAKTTFGYDGDGERTSEVAPDGNLSGANAGNYTTVTNYNADGDVSWTSQGDGSGYTDTPRTTYDYYDANGNETSQKDPRGYSTTYTFNADDQQTEVTDPDGNTTLTCYDANGNTAQTIPPVGVAANSLTPGSCPTSYPAGYSARLASDATVDQYNAEGNQIVETTPTPAGQSASYETTDDFFDPAGNDVETISPSTNSSTGPQSLSYESYDADGRLTAETTGCTSSETQAQCESYTSGTITAASWTSTGGGTATITASNLFSPGQTVTVSGMGVSAYNGSFTVATATSSQFTYSLPESSNPGSSSGGSATTSGSTTSYCYDPNGDQTAVVAPDGNVGSPGASCSLGTSPPPRTPVPRSRSPLPTRSRLDRSSAFKA